MKKKPSNLDEARAALLAETEKTSLELVAHKIDCTSQYVGLILKGKRNPSGATAKRILEAFDIPMEAWFDSEHAR